MKNVTLTGSMQKVRDEIETRLLAACKKLKPIDADDLEQIRHYKDGSFAMSLLGYMLYSNGHNLRAKSQNHPDGLLYQSEDCMFSVGIFRKTMVSKWHVMLSAPRGRRWTEGVEEFMDVLKPFRDERFGATYVRHLQPEQYQWLLAAGYTPVDAKPWDPRAPCEDETFNHKLVHLKDVVEVDKNDEFRVKNLPGEENRGFRVKTRLACNRFRNFLARNEFQFNLETYGPEYHATGEDLVRKHFALLKDPVGSTPHDYMSLVHYDATLGGDEIYARIGFIEGRRIRVPVMLFIGEKTCADTLALYATFAHRNPSILPSRCDTKGFSAISQYCYCTVFAELVTMGLRKANLGGSETEDLNTFKRQLGAQEQMSYWVLKS